MIFVVLGMHKSGTTLISQVLHDSGINMGEFDRAVGYDDGNKYEREACLAINLAALRATSHDVLDLAPRNVRADADIHARIAGLIDRCEAQHPDWGVKDPRLCLTFHLWAEHLPNHRLIAVYRDPARIWPRFKWRGRRGFAVNLRRATAFQRRWIEYNRGVLAAIAASRMPHILLDYHELMTGEAEFARLRSFVGRDLVDRRRPELYRSRAQGDLFLGLSGKWLDLRHGLRTADVHAELGRLRATEIDRAAPTDRPGDR